MLFFNNKKRKALNIAAQTTRFEIAWSIPRQQFMKQSAPDAPWWSDERFPTEPVAFARYQALEACVRQYNGEIAMYAVNYAQGDKVMREKLVHYSGSKKAPLRKDIEPASPAMQAALSELEETAKKRAEALATPAKPKAKNAKSDAATRSQPAKPAFNYLYLALAAAAVLVTCTAGGTYLSGTFSKPAAIRPQVQASYYISDMVVPTDTEGMCAHTLYDNRNGHSMYLGTEHCAEIKDSNREREKNLLASRGG